MDITRVHIFIAFFASLVIALALTPLAIKVAPKIGAMDVPKDDRRMHDHPIPRFGGLAIFAATMVIMLVFLVGYREMRVVMLGGVLIYALGVVDDLLDLPAKLKFVIEFGVASLLYAMGLRIELLGSLDWHLSGVLCFVVTVLWLVGITNTVNLVDGIDGLASGVAAIAALSVAYVAYIHGDRLGLYPVCLAMMAVAGSSLGFLPFNWYPAKTFMGDSGALFLGYMIAALSVVGPLRKSTLIAVIVPVMVMGLPIMDTFLAIIRRLINRQPVMGADKDHLHHRLMETGYGVRRVCLMIYGICGIMGMAAVLLSRELPKDALVLIAIAVVYIYVFLTDPGQVAPHLRKMAKAAGTLDENGGPAAKDGRGSGKGGPGASGAEAAKATPRPPKKAGDGLTFREATMHDPIAPPLRDRDKQQ